MAAYRYKAVSTDPGKKTMTTRMGTTIPAPSLEDKLKESSARFANADGKVGVAKPLQKKLSGRVMSNTPTYKPMPKAAVKDSTTVIGGAAGQARMTRAYGQAFGKR